jgi:small subunit ribosomal protein S23
MRGRNLKPSRVYQTASLLLESKAISQPPPWFDVIGTIPPGEILTRTQPVQHRVANHKSRVRKPSKLFRPQPIEFEEDQLRREFYRDHPWELARPRIILENDGRDGQMCNWSKMQQRGRQLNGERYGVWLMNVKASC